MKESSKKSAAKKPEREPGELARLTLLSLNRHIADEAAGAGVEVKADAAADEKAETDALGGGRHPATQRYQIETYRRFGGHKRRYRIVDFRRDKPGVPGRVTQIEYDPNRSAHIALITYLDGEKRYIIAPAGLEVGKTVMSGPDADILPGNALPIRNIPLGTQVHNIELRPGKGGQLARRPGSFAELVAKGGDYAELHMPSGEVRRVPVVCMATIGRVSEAEREKVSYGKAGRTRWKSVRLQSGEEDKESGGRRPVTPWGQPARGYKTRGKKHGEKSAPRQRKAR